MWMVVASNYDWPTSSTGTKVAIGTEVMASGPRDAALALHRFGLGPRAGSIASVASDPRGALLEELNRPRAGQVDNPSLQTSAAANRMVFENNAKQLAQQ